MLKGLLSFADLSKLDLDNSPESDAQASENDSEGGVENPDDVPDRIVRLPALLGASLANNLEVHLKRLDALPLVRRLSDDWRSREVTDCSIVVLRILALRDILHVSKISIEDLYPGLADSRYAGWEVLVPQGGYSPEPVQKQLSGQQFAQLMKEPARKAFAFIGPGNKGSDSWIFLEIAPGQRQPAKNKWLIVQFESKSRKAPQTVSAQQIQAEFEKTFRPPL